MKLFLTVFCSLFLASSLYAHSPCTQHQCTAIIDVGSTGSRLHVFSYDLDDSKSPIHINEIWSKKVKPGFSSVELNSNAIHSYLTDLFIGAPNQSMPVYFYATAGMRLLPAPKQKMYYKEVENWFSQQSQWQLIEAKTITGHEEALYDWLSVNYHIGTFKSPENKAIGVMDIGGASVQIIFPMEHPKEKAPIEFDLYDQHFKLFAHSFLGIGQTEMSHQFLNSSTCFSNNYPLPDGKSGQGNASSCEQKVSSLMNQVHEVNELIQPTLNENRVDAWYAIGGISYFANVSLFHFENNQLTNEDLLQQGDNQVCQQSWDVLSASFPNEESLFGYCLLSAYYYALMVHGYGISPEQKVNYIPAKENLDWTKGVILARSIKKLQMAQ